MTRTEKIRYVADSITGSCLSEVEVWEINGGIGWHTDDVEDQGTFRLSENDLRVAIAMATGRKIHPDA